MTELKQPAKLQVAKFKRLLSDALELSRIIFYRAMLRITRT